MHQQSKLVAGKNILISKTENVTVLFFHDESNGQSCTVAISYKTIRDSNSEISTENVISPLTAFDSFEEGKLAYQDLVYQYEHAV